MQNDPQLSKFSIMPSLRYHGRLESKAKMRPWQAILTFLVVTCCVYPATPIAAEKKTVMNVFLKGTWANKETFSEEADVYMFLENHEFRFLEAGHRAGEWRHEELNGVWETGKDFCWLGNEPNKTYGNLMIYVGTVQCCLSVRWLGNKMVLSEIWSKGDPSGVFSTYCKNRVLSTIELPEE